MLLFSRTIFVGLWPGLATDSIRVISGVCISESLHRYLSGEGYKYGVYRIATCPALGFVIV